MNQARFYLCYIKLISDDCILEDESCRKTESDLTISHRAVGFRAAEWIMGQLEYRANVRGECLTELTLARENGRDYNGASLT